MAEEKPKKKKVRGVGGKFLPGNQVGVAGRPRGTKTRPELKRMLLDKSPEIIQKVLDLALAGDPMALKLCLERLIPALKPMDDAISIGGVAVAEGLAEKGNLIFNAMADSTISPSQAAMLLGALGNMARIEETTELANRIKLLEGGDNVVIEGPA